VLLVPLFPLPRVWLFPRVVLPLHIFEPRYRQMIEDILDGPGRIVLGTIVPGHEAEHLGAPPVEAIGGLGEIGHHERLADGRFHLFLVGLARVRIREVQSERPYRMVEAEPVDEDLPRDAEYETLREAICKEIQERVPMKKRGRIPNHEPLSLLVDYLTLHLNLGHQDMQALYNELDPLMRARAVLRRCA
jgi:Lon protease-like protein